MNLTELVKILNNDLTNPFKFKLNPIHSTHATVKGGVNIEFLGYSDSISEDISIVPSELIPKIVCDKNSYKLLKWINTKLFTASLHCLLNNSNAYHLTEGVRLRIAVNMISKQKNLSHEEQEEWIMQLHNTYYERKRVISNYYFREIAQVPF